MLASVRSGRGFFALAQAILALARTLLSLLLSNDKLRKIPLRSSSLRKPQARLQLALALFLLARSMGHLAFAGIVLASLLLVWLAATTLRLCSGLIDRHSFGLFPLVGRTISGDDPQVRP